MKKWRTTATLAALLVAVASALACGRTGLLNLDDDVIPPDTLADAGDGGAADGHTGDADIVPNALDAAIIAIGDAEVANDQQIATGEGHACLRTTKGEVFCWGSNELGQLGDGTQTNRASAKKVEGLPSIVRVATGTHHSCALAVDESVWCWGGNTQGEQGQGAQTADPVFKPTKVPVPGVIAISAGGYHTCAHDVAGRVYCWGHNTFGECGSVGQAFVTTPKQVPNLGKVLEVATGWEHTCAIMADRTVQCWGRNQDGQIGNSTAGADERDPAVAVGVHDVRALFAGDDHTCALLLDGSMQCWGDNENGELGSGNAVFSNRAVPVSNMNDAYQGGGGREHSCVATNGGGVYCWGQNLASELGIGPPSYISKIPLRVVNLDDARWVAAGQAFSCAAHKEKGAMCWGTNDRGQLGSGTMNDFGDKPGYPNEVTGL
jgi:alpha-tubulin suppressor-like RCC1 family protein